jgi:hypothetical protein
LTWKIWSLDWENPASVEHTITPRAIDTAGNIQPTMDDPQLLLTPHRSPDTLRVMVRSNESGA